MSVKTGNSSASSTKDRDRRRSDRAEKHVIAFVSTADGTTRVAVSDVNLSHHGVGFTSFHPFAEGMFCLIEIGFGEQRLISEIHVISTTSARNGQHKIGAEFC
jgi:hypothetical protein